MSRPAGRKVVVSLHDATPFHLERMRRAEALFRGLGLRKITYLLVPEYHGGYPAAEDSAFGEWCRAGRPFRVAWHLHGYRHLEDPAAASGGGAGDFLKRRLLTAGEGEFLALEADAQRERIEAGRRVFRACLGYDPTGFVAPAWLFNAALTGVLRETGFTHTEDQRRLYRVDRVDAGDRVGRDTGAEWAGGERCMEGKGRSQGAGRNESMTGVAHLDSPVVTWATRTLLRKYGSLVVCPILLRMWAAAPILRIAMHPFDFDHPETVASIRAVLGRALRTREQAFVEELEFPGA